MYKPKESIRWRPRVSIPIRLGDQCLNAVVDYLIRVANTLTRNCREKKAIRDYLYTNLPASLQQDIMRNAVDRLVGAQNTLNLLDLFDPTKMAKENLDLLGPFRMGFGCYTKDARLTWSQGSAKKFNLTEAQLERLYNILIWASPATLKELIVSVARESLKTSKFSNLLAKGRCLTKVVILSGAENHTLRILGINCPSLAHLDVSHSMRVSDQGLRNLLLKRPPRLKHRNRVSASGPGAMVEADGSVHQEYGNPYIQETNGCAETLCSLSLLGTAVTWDGCDYVCKVMKHGYLYSSLPLVKIVKRKYPLNRREENLIFNRRLLAFLSDTWLSEEMQAVIGLCLDNVLPAEELGNITIDHYSPLSTSGGIIQETDSRQTHIYARRFDSFKLSLHMKIESAVITSLVLPWYSFTWRMDSLVSLDTLGLFLPNLKFLRARVRGIWHQAGEPFLPNLEVCNVWSLNSSTGLSLLQSLVSTKVFEFNNTQTLNVNPFEELTDATLESCIQLNQSLAGCLEEIIIRPTKLSTKSLYTIVNGCPNIKRIGDLESWNVPSADISTFNRHLDAIRSPCVLSIMNFPPSSNEKVEWI